MMNLDRLREDGERFFANPHEAWRHFVKHVLNNQGEWDNWAVLIPALAVVLTQGERAAYHEQALQAGPDRVPANLLPLWQAYRRLLRDSFDLALDLEWVWLEEHNNEENNLEEQHVVFAPSGILLIVRAGRLRTSFIPLKRAVGPDLPHGLAREYLLYRRCRQHLFARDYTMAMNEGRMRCESQELQRAIAADLPQPYWEQLRPNWREES